MDIYGTFRGASRQFVAVFAFGLAVTQNESRAETRCDVFVQHQNIVCMPE
jgi:hypothetical protein